jgi:hypothetical protein
MKNPQTMAAFTIAISAMAEVPHTDLFYVADKKIAALYPHMDMQNRHMVVLEALNCWQTYIDYLGELEVRTGELQ